MPTIFSHPAVLLALRPRFRLPASIYAIGAICSILPDVDIVGFRFGIQYGDLLGHRGLTHSLFFAALISLLFTVLIKWISSPLGNRRVFAFLFCSTASHGFLDALTNGGLGVAFLSPFTNERYFFPWRPIEVSPFGMHRLLSTSAAQVFQSEFTFVWLPSFLVFVTLTLAGSRKK